MTDHYTNLALLQASLGADVVTQLYDDDGTGDPDSGPLARMLSDVDAVIDSTLAGVYPVPFAAAPAIIQAVANLLAQAYSQQRHPEYVRVDGEAMRTEAMDLLSKLKSGEMQIPGVLRLNDGAEVATGTSSNTGGARQPGPKMFGDGLADFNGVWPWGDGTWRPR